MEGHAPRGGPRARAPAARWRPAAVEITVTLEVQAVTPSYAAELRRVARMPVKAIFMSGLAPTF